MSILDRVLYYQAEDMIKAPNCWNSTQLTSINKVCYIVSYETMNLLQTPLISNLINYNCYTRPCMCIIRHVPQDSYLPFSICGYKVSCVRDKICFVACSPNVGYDRIYPHNFFHSPRAILLHTVTCNTTLEVRGTFCLDGSTTFVVDHYTLLYMEACGLLAIG